MTTKNTIQTDLLGETCMLTYGADLLNEAYRKVMADRHDDFCHTAKIRACYTDGGTVMLALMMMNGELKDVPMQHVAIVTTDPGENDPLSVIAAALQACTTTLDCFNRGANVDAEEIVMDLTRRLESAAVALGIKKGGAS